ncbi:MAG TPA: hypothetical protein DCF81_17935 [Erythrobacter sp.]|nr:hypothetical protein [Erythrobacter sp.]
MIWLRRFFADMIGSYLDSLRALRALPWLFAAIVLWEFAQHVVEVRIGMFESRDMARLRNDNGLRMAFGWIKMTSIYVGAFFVIRHFASQREGRVLAPLGTAALRFLPYVLYALVVFAAMFYARALVPEVHVTALRSALGLGQLLIEPLLMTWVVAAATDGRVANPLVSARRLGWLYGLALPLYILTRLPFSLLHQQLNRLSIGEAGIQLWGLLALDSLVVGLIVAISPSAMVRIAHWTELRQAGAKTRETAVVSP